jgi:protein involved in polysaccharide export with SLBB domain
MQSLGHEPRSPRLNDPRIVTGLLALVCLATTSGCFAPFCYSGIPACDLPDSFRMPTRSTAPRLNMANLALPTPNEYILGMNDTLEVTIPDLLRRGEINPIQVQITASGEIQLPLVSAVKVGGMNLAQAQKAINDAYEGVLVNPRAVVRMFQKATVDVVVLGEVTTPGHYPLNKYENDVAHAVAAAAGMTRDADLFIEIHRRGTVHRIDPRKMPMPPQPAPGAEDGMAQRGKNRKIKSVTVSIASGFEPGKDKLVFEEQNGIKGQYDDAKGVLTLQGAATVNQYEAALRSVSYENASEDLLDADRNVTFDVKVDDAPYDTDAPAAPPREQSVTRIPLRGSEVDQPMNLGDVIKYPGDGLTMEDITLEQGDVVVVPRRRREVFWVVGQLNFNLSNRFSLRQDDRDLGGGFNLPLDRDIDVVTAVAMAGYIDPIDSPTTVSVQRQQPDGPPLVIIVDLIKARYDERETVLVQPGDIIYINPDGAWWMRRQWDRIFPSLFQVVSGNWVFRF